METDMKANKSDQMSVRVRFAPSPTGRVHIGNIRVAIFNWLFARHEGGEFLLRLEDTDRERSTPDAVEAVLNAMNWLGLDYDEEPLYQSTRRDAHLAVAERLLGEGHAYREDKGRMGRGECVVFRMPEEDMSFHDEIKGTLRKGAGDVKDFVIVRSDGSPVFQLANVADDIEMKITHVIRGDDHIENTYRHVALYRALGADVPKFAHLPMIVNQGGKPYSKRDGDAYVGEFTDKGFDPNALFNYLSLLGWSPGEDREKMTREEAIVLFSLDRVKSGPAQMDLRKLAHLNGQYVAELPPDEFVRAVGKTVERNEWGVHIDEGYFRRVCALLQSRTQVYSDAASWKYFFSEDIEYDEKAVRKMLKKEGRKVSLGSLGQRLAEVEFDQISIEHAIRRTERESDVPRGKLNQPVRVAVTGLSRGAGLYETMELLGKNRVLRRLGYAVENLCM